MKGFKHRNVGYILKLNDDCYYVGISTKGLSRIKAHFDGKGSAWTKLHSPTNLIKFEHMSPDKFKNWEKQTTLDMMRAHGWRCVRGYCWTARNLRKPPYGIPWN